MRATPDMTNAIFTAVRHLETHGAKRLYRGRSVHGGSRLTPWATVLDECCNMRELQFHFNLFCQELGCRSFVLRLSENENDNDYHPFTHLINKGLIEGILPMRPIESTDS